jgi:chromosome partitioning protein
MRKIALVNQKGGCGKTTTAINLASCLALEGKRVLLIDLDPQGHSALGLGVSPNDIEKSIYEVLLGQIPIKEAIWILRENLHAILSDVVLSAFEQVMSGAEGREFRLEKSLDDLPYGYDYWIIDSPPSVGLLTFNGLMVCNEVIIPVDSSFFSLHGLGKLLHTLALVQEKREKELSVKILATIFDSRTRYSKYVINTLREHFQDQCFETVIHTCTRLREAAGKGKPIAEYDKGCQGFADYRRLTEEVLKAEAAMAEFAPVRQQQREEEKPIVFTFEAPASAGVQIAGDFNNWRPESLYFNDSSDDHTWQKLIPLKPGSYRYKYLIDGRWITDPRNKKTVDDPFGGANSILEIQ